MQRILSIPMLVTTAIVAIPFGAASIAGPISTAGTAHAAATKKTTTAATVKFTGPVESMQWGDVQVTLMIKAKKIVSVPTTAPTERARSQYINSIAVPLLVKEVLKVQGSNIPNYVSGATMTSDAFYASLQGAVQAAKKAGKL